MITHDRIVAIRSLADIGCDYPELQTMILGAIRDTAGPAPEPVPSSSSDPTLSEILRGKNGGKIDAIKEYRARTGLGLKEAKDAIEGAFNRLGLQFFCGVKPDAA